jgi:hypothetical protein
MCHGFLGGGRVGWRWLRLWGWLERSECEDAIVHQLQAHMVEDSPNHNSILDLALGPCTLPDPIPHQ